MAMQALGALGPSVSYEEQGTALSRRIYHTSLKNTVIRWSLEMNAREPLTTRTQDDDRACLQVHTLTL